ncbi:DUF6388 family protein [Pseudomonas sp. KFB-139]|uniref:DUF6388 family protein n=1 Tax=Pseudomonas serbiensis TaxID=3064350 RepID=A0ABT9CQG3_9PSED|nr:DUF6388 family protein [Pseudomonas sp. KFB-138]MDO7927732.1 DUF6388 family protein [Pseudomonas sp. KFB-138]
MAYTTSIGAGIFEQEKLIDMRSRYQAAYEKYFGNNPQAVAEIESVSQKMIEHLGITMEEWRQTERHRIFAEAAKARGLEIGEFVIRLMAESPEQAHAWRLENHRRMADTLGIPWDEYKQLNRINE